MTSSMNQDQIVLLVDDEQESLRSLELMLRSNGVSNVLSCYDSREVYEILETHNIGVMLLDLIMPHIGGEEILEYVQEKYPQIPVIIMTAINKVDVAVKCMKLNALDYLVKPLEITRLTSSVKRALEASELQRENERLKQQVMSNRVEDIEAFDEIVTRDEKMFSIFKYISAIAPSSQPVLVTGETGVGKELIARAIHDVSKVSGKFVPVNVAGLDDNVFSDTLFGHRRGAFTGADTNRSGLLETADNGTIFLDEIGDLTMASQVKLLRLIQENEYLPLGSDVQKKANCRIIVATNANLVEKQAIGSFRNDLFFRLNTHHIHIPPLRERINDIHLLLIHFLQKSSEMLEKSLPSYPQELLALLSSYHYPGNVRELEGMIYDAVADHESHILSMEKFKNYIFKTKEGELTTLDIEDEEEKVKFPLKLPTFKEIENYLIEEAMKRSGNNQSIAAKMLGISRQALNKRLKIIKENISAD